MKSRQRNNHTRSDENPALDNGWAWMVCLGAHLCMVFSSGYQTTLGILYIEWKEYFDLTAAASSWIVSIPFLVASPLSLFSGVIASRLGVRRVSMAGAVLNGLATILGSFATDVWQLYLCGALSGLGMTMMVPPAMIVLIQYFKKRFALANGIVNVGGNISQMLLPPLFRLLIANYGWRGTMFTFGALQLNGVAACALFRPLKTNNDKVRNVEMEDLEAAKSSHNRLQENKNKPFMNILTIFTDIPTILTVLVTSFFAMSLIINLAHLPARAVEAGWSDDQSAMLLTVYAVASIITRSFHGWFVDRNYIGSFKLQLIVLLGCAIVNFLNPVSDNFIFLVGYTFFLGSFIGIGTPLLLVNAKSLVSPSQVPATVSVIIAAFFLFNGTGAVIAGKIYDTTGNYVAPFLVAGGMSMVAFLLFAVVTVMKRRQDKCLRRKIARTAQYEESAL